MLFGIALMALAALVGLLLFKGGFQSSCCACGQSKTADRQAPKTAP